jgi:dTDP-D-glucose 4,6-dehydratase
MQIRDWLYVDDHCRAILAVIERGREGEVYNIGGSRALPNIEVVHKILDAVGKPYSLMQTVKDRPGHDRRYALSSEKLMHETGWKPSQPFEAGLQSTIDWYRQNAGWVARVKSGAYQIGRSSKSLYCVGDPNGLGCCPKGFGEDPDEFGVCPKGLGAGAALFGGCPVWFGCPD